MLRLRGSGSEGLALPSSDKGEDGGMSLGVASMYWPRVMYAPQRLAGGQGSIDLPVALEYEDGHIVLIDDIKGSHARPPEGWPYWDRVVEETL
jgi:hypothetical protein